MLACNADARLPEKEASSDEGGVDGAAVGVGVAVALAMLKREAADAEARCWATAAGSAV
jgi:hypothetical protein